MNAKQKQPWGNLTQGKLDITGNIIQGMKRRNFCKNTGISSNLMPSPPTLMLINKVVDVINGNMKMGSTMVRSVNQSIPPVFRDSTG